jgi:hypothetical protein
MIETENCFGKQVISKDFWPIMCPHLNLPEIFP